MRIVPNFFPQKLYSSSTFSDGFWKKQTCQDKNKLKGNIFSFIPVHSEVENQVQDWKKTRLMGQSIQLKSFHLQNFKFLTFTFKHRDSVRSKKELHDYFYILSIYRKVPSSRPVYYSIFELFGQRYIVHRHQISPS